MRLLKWFILFIFPFEHEQVQLYCLIKPILIIFCIHKYNIFVLRCTSLDMHKLLNNVASIMPISLLLLAAFQ